MSVHGLATRSRQCGFTLIEVIVVIVILSIVGSIGATFVVTAVDAYHITEIRQKLTHRARVSTEQMSRELHMALPNAVRISSSGNCIEFFPIVAGAHYLQPLPTIHNGQAKVSSIDTTRFTVGLGSAEYVAVAPFASGEVFTNADPSAISAAGALGVPPYTTIPLAGDHRFLRNSGQQRAYIIDNPVRFCVTQGTLVRYSDYGLDTAALLESDPGGDAALMAHSVQSLGTAFELSPGAEDRNTTIFINLRYTNASQSMDIRHQVGIKNVP